MNVQTVRDALVVRIGVRFDSPLSAELERRLEPLAPIRRIVVDFREVREADDFAVARLWSSLRRVAASVAFRGLSRHHRRVLRYLDEGAPGETTT